MSEVPIPLTDLLRWSEALSALARTGLGFTESLYERERFQEILHIAGEMRHYLRDHVPLVRPPRELVGDTHDASSGMLKCPSASHAGLRVGWLCYPGRAGVVGVLHTNSYESARRDRPSPSSRTLARRPPATPTGGRWPTWNSTRRTGPDLRRASAEGNKNAAEAALLLPGAAAVTRPWPWRAVRPGTGPASAAGVAGRSVA